MVNNTTEENTKKLVPPSVDILQNQKLHNKNCVLTEENLKFKSDKEDLTQENLNKNEDILKLKEYIKKIKLDKFAKLHVSQLKNENLEAIVNKDKVLIEKLTKENIFLKNQIESLTKNELSLEGKIEMLKSKLELVKI